MAGRSRPHRTRLERAALTALAVSTMATIATACGISTDTAPRQIATGADAADTDGVTGTSDGNTATGSGLVYLVQVDNSGTPARLVTVPRDVQVGSDRDPTSLIEVLIAGPNADERQKSYVTLMPPGTELLGWSARGSGVVTVDLSAEFAELAGPELTYALAQIVYTLTEATDVIGVRITVEGAVERWPDVNGQLQSDPLTLFDYPGVVRSSQPDFPAIPSGRPDGA